MATDQVLSQDTTIKSGFDTPDTLDVKGKEKEIDSTPINQDKKVIYVKFDEPDLEKVKQLIEKEMQRITNKYDEVGFTDKCETMKEKFDAEHDEDSKSAVSGNYDIRLPLHKLIVTVLVDMAIKQMFSANPLVLMEREGPISDDDLHIRQNKLDFLLRKKLRFEEVCRAIFEHAIYEPVCITETTDYYDCEEYNTSIETYQATPEGIAKFEKDFGLIHDEDSPEFRNKILLEAGQEVTVPVTGPKVIYDGPKVVRIDNEKFYANPEQKDFRKMRCLGKEVSLTGPEVEMRANSDKYSWDKDAVAKIRDAYGKEFDSKTIKFLEKIILFDKGDKGQLKRYVVTMEVRSREIVRSILHTEDDIQYDSHSINPKDDSWIGESLLEMINELISIIQSNLNYMLYSNDLAHTPVIMSDDPNSVTRKAITLGITNVIAAAKGSVMQQVTFGSTGFDRMALVEQIFQLVYLFAGVNVTSLSGGVNQTDPRAGVGKTALATQVANLRVTTMITRLLYGIVSVVEKVEKIMFKNSETLDYWDNGKEIKVPKQIYGTPVRYIINGSTMTFNPEMDLNSFIKFMQIATGIVPELLHIDEFRREALEIVIQDVGGSVSKHKEQLVKWFDSFLKVKKAMEAAKQKAQGSQQGTQGQPESKPIPAINTGAGTPSIPNNDGGMPAGDSGAGAQQ